MSEFLLGMVAGGVVVGIVETLVCLYLIGWLDGLVGHRISATLDAMLKREEKNAEQF